jgi:hypothetical protein
MSSYQGQLVDKAAKEVFEITWDGMAGRWSVTIENKDRAKEADLYAMYLKRMTRNYGPADGPFLRYCLWHLERDSQLVLKDGLPEEPEGSDPNRVY